MKGISVVGLGKLGLPMAACLASKGYKVIGVDVSLKTVMAVNGGRSPIYEPGLRELLERCRGSLSATDDFNLAIDDSDVTFIVVPTPSNDTGGFSTKFVEAAVASVGRALRSKQGFHVVALTSTVLPGVTERVLRPLLEGASGKQCGVDFGLCYNPEFIALGSVIRDFQNPDMVLIGESDRRAGEIVADIYRRVCDNDPSLARMTPYNAELTKIALNTYVTMKIAYANTIAELCENIPGGDVDVVTGALGLDARIGSRYLKGGLGYGGPCFPRDNKALSFFARGVGCQAKLCEATDHVNDYQTDRIVRLVRQKLVEVEGKKIALLGLTYKADTDVTEESAALKIATALIQSGAKVQIYDPSVTSGGWSAPKDEKMTFADSAFACLDGADLCILATPWHDFAELTVEDFQRNMKSPVLLDCWRFFDRPEFREKLDCLAVGMVPAQQVAKVEVAS